MEQPVQYNISATVSRGMKEDIANVVAEGDYLNVSDFFRHAVEALLEEYQK